MIPQGSTSSSPMAQADSRMAPRFDRLLLSFLYGPLASLSLYVLYILRVHHSIHNYFVDTFSIALRNLFQDSTDSNFLDTWQRF